MIITAACFTIQKVQDWWLDNYIKQGYLPKKNPKIAYCPAVLKGTVPANGTSYTSTEYYSTYGRFSLGDTLHSGRSFKFNNNGGATNGMRGWLMKRIKYPSAFINMGDSQIKGGSRQSSFVKPREAIQPIFLSALIRTMAIFCLRLEMSNLSSILSIYAQRY